MRLFQHFLEFTDLLQSQIVLHLPQGLGENNGQLPGENGYRDGILVLMTEVLRPILLGG